MAKTKVSEWSAIPANNTDVGGVDINEGCAPSGINNAIRDMMAQIKDMQTGADGDNFVVGGNLAVTGTSTFTGGISGAFNGTVGATTPNTGAFTALSTTGNTTIGDASADSLTVNATPTFNVAIPVSSGGTGATSVTANSVVLGNGTSALSGNLVAPGTSGNVLTSNGTTWTSAALNFDKSLSTNGYQKIPGGLIIQWGITSSISSDGSVTVTLPIAFPNAMLVATASGYNISTSGAAGPSMITASYSTSSFVIRNDNTAAQATWIAIGY
jgi:hypothetical protein